MLQSKVPVGHSFHIPQRAYASPMLVILKPLLCLYILLLSLLFFSLEQSSQEFVCSKNKLLGLLPFFFFSKSLFSNISLSAPIYISFLAFFFFTLLFFF